MAQPTPVNYRTGQLSNYPPPPATDGVMDQLTETARDVGERAEKMAGDVATAIKERPYTTLAIAGGLAFALGALWKLGHQRPRSRLEELAARLPELPSRERIESLLPRRWR